MTACRSATHSFTRGSSSRVTGSQTVYKRGSPRRSRSLSVFGIVYYLRGSAADGLPIGSLTCYRLRSRLRPGGPFYRSAQRIPVPAPIVGACVRSCRNSLPSSHAEGGVIFWAVYHLRY